ncbi:hypothetical protein H5410_043382 [Solanum commersonii]|uniref:Uncharacterized protein n=1 Tax=Solanum commersonii TaxID=4109 RepID=A0A9J5Y0I5_SOLCO|nr:hypothetical protein H5410_043382 [Solanum commersonii]
MSKKHTETPQKSVRSVEGTYIDHVHVPTFNILTQTPRLKGMKFRRRVVHLAKKRPISANQKGKNRKGKIVETPSESDSDFFSKTKKKKRKKTTNVEVAQSSKPSTRSTTKKKESEIPTSKKHKKIVRRGFNNFSNKHLLVYFMTYTT